MRLQGAPDINTVKLYKQQFQVFSGCEWCRHGCSVSVLSPAWSPLTLWRRSLWTLPLSPSSWRLFLCLKKQRNTQTVTFLVSRVKLVLTKESRWIRRAFVSWATLNPTPVNVTYFVIKGHRRCTRRKTRLRLNRHLGFVLMKWCVSSPSKSLRSSRTSRSLSLMTFPLEALTSLSGTNITAKISLQFQGSST